MDCGSDVRNGKQTLSDLARKQGPLSGFGVIQQFAGVFGGEGGVLFAAEHAGDFVENRCYFIEKNPGQTNIVKMKVKVGQLKAGLSQYLREVQETGESLEVCVREMPVAYLTPIPSERDTGSSLNPETMERLRAAGIRVIPARKPKGDWVPIPGKTDDIRVMANTVVSMREEKNW